MSSQAMTFGSKTTIVASSSSLRTSVRRNVRSNRTTTTKAQQQQQRRLAIGSNNHHTSSMMVKSSPALRSRIVGKSSTDEDGFSGTVVLDVDEVPDECDVRNPDPKKCEPVRLKIDDVWYDARGWAKAHPGGERWIHFFDGRDATDAFYALHSYGPNGADLALRRLKKLPKCDPPADTSKLPTDRQYEISMGFREFRKKLEADGFFKRNAVKEIWALSQVVALYGVGTAVAYSHPIIATVLLALGAVQAGWLGHDYVHGRGKLCDSMRYMPTLLNGHSVEWWTQKHSMHHTFTNEEDMDGDVMMEPFFYLRHPKDSGRPDSPMRKWQHIYGYPLLSIMYWLWRSHSVKVAFKEKRWKEIILMGLNYVWLATCMPWQVALGSVTLGGFIVGSLVSATHQSEEIMDASNAGEYVDGQFRSTRDAETVFGPLETWIWGTY